MTQNKQKKILTNFYLPADLFADMTAEVERSSGNKTHWLTKAVEEKLAKSKREQELDVMP